MVTLAGGCSDTNDIDDAQPRLTESQQIVQNLERAGFVSADIAVAADGTVYVGQDAVVTLQASRELAGIIDDSEVEDGFRQYRTTNMIDTTRVQTVCVNPSSDFLNNASMLQALDASIENYNSQTLQFSMQRGGNGCDANIAAYLDNGGGGVAGFPSGGNPYHEFYIGASLAADYGVDVATHVITHEMGHCIGFRHTDYYNRSISCGGSATNEGASGVGAIHIEGTPSTAVMNGSVMNSCFNQNSSGQWTTDDVVALDCLYDSGSCAPEAPPSYDNAIDLQGGLSGNAQAQFGPYDASTYDAIRFQLSGGTGDADLYVRFGAAPTTDTWDCRPYASGNEEICEFNPAGNGNYYVMINAYSAYSGLTLTVDGSGGEDAPPPPDDEVCDDNVDNDNDGATDCDDSDCNGDPVCEPDPPPPGGWVELVNTDFEGGWDVFNDGGSDVRRNSKDAAYAFSGNYCVRLRDNSGTGSSMSSDAIDLSGYSELEVSFNFYARSMENNEDFFVELYDGGSWVAVANFSSGGDFDNDQGYAVTIPVDSGDVNFSAAAQLRIRADASNNSDFVYIDDVVVNAQ